MFNKESELVELFIKKQSQKKNRKIVTELTTNYGRPDIVEIVYSEKVFQFRKNFEKVQLDRIDSYILTFLYRKSWVNIETILKKTSISKSTLNKSLERLKQRGLISMFENKVKLHGKSKTLAIKQINVYEAKLSNWKYVIEQAERHFWFSNNSSILLPELSDDVFENCSLACKKRGLGFMISNGKKIRTIHNQNSKPLINTPLLWELNEKLIDGSL